MKNLFLAYKTLLRQSKHELLVAQGVKLAVVATLILVPTLSLLDFSNYSNILLLVGLLFLTLFFNHIILYLSQLNGKLDHVVQQRTKQLHYQLYHDRLTGLYNRYALDKHLKEHFTTILLIDIDKFHNYNELYGVEIGNHVLKSFGLFIQAFAKEHGYDAYRIYGDGFILKAHETVLSHDVILRDIRLFLDSLAHQSVQVEIGEELLSIEIDATISIAMEREYALEKATIALKYAREQQKEFLAYYHAINTEKELKETLYWRREIKNALKEERMVPLFQPIVDEDGSVLKYEVLMRLKQKEKYVSPALFLDIAQKTKQYKYITRAMIQKSFEMMQDQKEDFSINLLFADIRDKETMHFLKEQIRRFDIGHRLVLEIVESEDIQDYELLKRLIGDFRREGVRIAIDDFGSGFSNYAYILEIAPDYVKIDGSLIKEIDRDEDAYKLVNSIQTLAASLGIKTIAEYIHSKAVFERVQKLGIDEFQGYYFSEPLTIDALKERELAPLGV